MDAPVRALFMRHDHVSPPGLIGEAFEARGYDVQTQLVVPEEHYSSPNVHVDFPDPTQFDVLIPMGAPWGAWDDERIGNWLLPELQWLRDADAAGVPVLGLCFGGQLLARAHGGTVSRAPVHEIGWLPVWSDDPSLVPEGPWFQFHYDRFTVPPEGTEIARTSRASQAFTLRRNLGLQFHPELTAAMLQGWYDSPGQAGDHVAHDGQDPDILVAQTQAFEPAARERARVLVNSFLDRVASS